MNATLKTIYERRSLRKYKNQPVDKSLIEQIIDAGRMAPSAMNRQPWKFYVVTDRIKINSLSGAIAKVAESFFPLSHGMVNTETADIIFHQAPVVIFITAPRNKEWTGIDIGMCTLNMMLAAKSIGLDTCPVGLAKYLELADRKTFLSLPDAEEIHLAIVLGYGDEKPEVHERKKDNMKFV